MRRSPRWLAFAALLTLVTAVRPGAVLAFQEPETLQEAAAAEHAEVAHEATEPNLLGFDPNLAFYTLVVFGILLLVLGRYAWKPLIKALEDREHRFQQAFDETERVRAEAAALLEKNRAQLAGAHEQIRALIDEARRDAQSTADEIVRKAQAEADAGRDRARREIGAAKDEALMEIWTRSADLAVSVAEKVLERDMSADEHRRLIDLATQQIPAPTASNGRGGA